MNITLKLFATLTDYLPADAKGNIAQLQLDDDTPLGTLLDDLKLPEKLVHLVLVNGAYGKRIAESLNYLGREHVVLDKGDYMPPRGAEVDRAPRVGVVGVGVVDPQQGRDPGDLQRAELEAVALGQAQQGQALGPHRPQPREVFLGDHAVLVALQQLLVARVGHGDDGLGERPRVAFVQRPAQLQARIEPALEHLLPALEPGELRRCVLLEPLGLGTYVTEGEGAPYWDGTFAYANLGVLFALVVSFLVTYAARKAKVARQEGRA